MNSRFGYLVLILPMMVAGCASTPEVQQPKDPILSTTPVSGQGTASDHAAIQSSNQQIFNSEHSMSGSTPTAPTQGIP